MRTINLFTKFTFDLYENMEEYNKFLLETGNEEHELTNQDGHVICIDYEDGINFSMYLNKDCDIYIKAHEVTHLIDFFMIKTGIDDVEFRAYMIEHVLRETNEQH